MLNLKVVTDPRFTARVAVEVPTPRGFEEHGFLAHFRALPVSERAGYDLRTPEGTLAFLQRAWAGAEELVGEDGEDVAWSDELRDRLLDMGFMRAPLVVAYFEGLTPAARGN